MRTTNNFQSMINAMAESCRWENIYKLGQDPARDSQVSGSICFIFNLCTDDEKLLGRLRNAILQVDIYAGWRDEDVRLELEPKSMGYLSAGEISLHNWSGPHQMVWFHFAPNPGHLKKSQLLAYRKYLDRLAQELAQNQLPGVIEVRSYMQTQSMTSFSV